MQIQIKENTFLENDLNQSNKAMQNKIKPVHPIIEKSLLFLLFLYPIVMIPVAHAASGIFLVFVLVGLFIGWPAWKHLIKIEKQILIFMSIFVFYALISIINADDLKHFGERVERLIRFSFAIPAYLLIKRLGPKILLALQNGLMFGGIILLLAVLIKYGTLEYVTLEYRAVLAGHNAVRFGIYAMSLSLISFCAAIFLELNYWRRILLFISAVSALLVSYLSGTRGAWLALIAFVFIVPLLLWKWKQNIKIMLAPMILFFIVLLILISLNPKIFIKRVAQFLPSSMINQEKVQRDTSVSQRVMLWKAALNTFQKHPIIGSGLGDFYLEKNHYIKDKPEFETIKKYKEGHGVYSEWLVINGIIGTLLMISSLLLLPLYVFYKAFLKNRNHPERRFAAAAGLVFIVAWMIFGIGITWLAFSGTTAIFLLYTLVFLSLLFDPKKTILKD